MDLIKILLADWLPLPLTVATVTEKSFTIWDKILPHFYAGTLNFRGLEGVFQRGSKSRYDVSQSALTSHCGRF